MNPLPFLGQSLADPRTTAAQVLALRLGRDALWPAMGLIVTISALFTALVPPGLQAPFTPLTIWAVTGALSVVSVFAMHLTGQMLGGTGSMVETLAIMTWIQVVTFAVQAGLTLAGLALGPQIASFAGLVAGAFLIRQLILAIDVLHGFGNIWRALGTVIVASVGLAIGLWLILSLILQMAGVTASV
jgi:hypothetical protein